MLSGGIVSLITEPMADVFFQFASTQRLEIVESLSERKYKMSEIAKKLDVTMPEIHRNLNRLQESNMVEKKPDGTYCLTSFGNMMHSIIPVVNYLKENQNYFNDHSLTSLPNKFIDRLGALSNSKLVHGYVKVAEKWKEIYSNADKFINNVLIEASYSDDIMKTISEKLQKDVTISSIFSDKPIITNEREEVIKKYGIKKSIQDEKIMRKMADDLSIAMILNEREAGISFPLSNGNIDMGNMFYSDNPDFHEWCLDYFEHMWKKSSRFQENKIRITG